MENSTTSFRTIFENPESFIWNYAVYASPNEEWKLETPCLVLDPNDAEEDEVPLAAEEKGFERVLGMTDFNMIIENAKLQKSEVTAEELFESFLYYFDNDAYMELT